MKMCFFYSCGLLSLQVTFTVPKGDAHPRGTVTHWALPVLTQMIFSD